MSVNINEEKPLFHEYRAQASFGYQINAGVLADLDPLSKSASGYGPGGQNPLWHRVHNAKFEINAGGV